MKTKLQHTPTGMVYANRKDAKLKMGHSNYNKAIRSGHMVLVNTYELCDILY